MARQPLDLYATRPKVAEAIVANLEATIAPPEVIIEPSAGPGAFVAAARMAWPTARIIAVDVDGAHREACLSAGANEFLERDWPTAAARLLPRWRARTLILGNPPFSKAQAHVDAALELLELSEHLVFLLKQSFRGAECRVSWWRTSPLEETALVIPRPGFIGGNDMTEYDVFRWTKGYRGRPWIAPPILWGAAAARDVAARDQLQLVGRGG